MRQNFLVSRRLFRFSLHFALERAEHDKFIRVSLLSPAIDFQIAQDKRASAIAFQKDEWIGRPKFRRIKHIGICLAGGNDEAGWFCFCFALLHLIILLRSIAIQVTPSEAKDLTLTCPDSNNRAQDTKHEFALAVRDPSTSLRSAQDDKLKVRQI